MRRSDLEDLERITMAEVVKRRGLGGYSTEAEGILLLNEALLKVIGHLIDEAPKAKK